MNFEPSIAIELYSLQQIACSDDFLPINAGHKTSKISLPQLEEKNALRQFA